MTHSLIPAYRELHKAGKFPGYSVTPYVSRIAELVRESGAKDLLDYGSGEGKQYTEKAVHDAWGGRPRPTLYDPGVPWLADRPFGKFDGVICTDVLEHIPEAELDEVIADIRGYARLWCFISVCCRPAKTNKLLPGGRNVHVTIQSQAWWQVLLRGHFPGDQLPALHLEFTP